MKSANGKGMKWAVAGVALAALMATASAASAGSVVIDKGVMTNPISVKLSGADFTGTVDDAPMQFTAVIGGKTDSILAFCVDVFHFINTGTYSPGLQYETNTLKTDSNPNPTSKDTLTTAQINQLNLLVNYGTDINNNTSLSANTKSVDLAEVQGAIWQVVAGEDVTLVGNSVDGVSASTFNTMVDNLSNAALDSTYMVGYGVIGTKTTFITPVSYPSSNGKQSFLFAGTVPEPASWAMMIGGMGLVGATLRRRRAASTAAVTA
jgi:hypothetical protein